MINKEKEIKETKELVQKNERTRMFINALERCIAACLEPVEN